MAAHDEQNLYSLPYDRVPPPTTNYNDLTHKPLINGIVLEGDHSLSELGINMPTKTSELTNDSGFITSTALPTKTSELTNDSGFITSAALPTKTSELTNDSGFITSAGGVLTGNVEVQKNGTGSTSAVVSATQINSSTGNNVAMLKADAEGGNLRLSKANNTAHLEIDTFAMDGSTGFARMYLGNSTSESSVIFTFGEDGDFVDGRNQNLSALARTKIVDGESIALSDFVTIQTGFTATSSIIKKIGNHIWGNIMFSGDATVSGGGTLHVATIKSPYLPNSVRAFAAIYNNTTSGQVQTPCVGYINSAGQIILIVGGGSRTIGNNSYPWCSASGLIIDYWL